VALLEDVIAQFKTKKPNLSPMLLVGKMLDILAQIKNPLNLSLDQEDSFALLLI